MWFAASASTSLKYCPGSICSMFVVDVVTSDHVSDCITVYQNDAVSVRLPLRLVQVCNIRFVKSYYYPKATLPRFLVLFKYTAPIEDSYYITDRYASRRYALIYSR